MTRQAVVGPTGQVALDLWRVIPEAVPPAGELVLSGIALRQVLRLFEAVCRTYGVTLPKPFPQPQHLKTLRVVNGQLYFQNSDQVLVFDTFAWLERKQGL